MTFILLNSMMCACAVAMCIASSPIESVLYLILAFCSAVMILFMFNVEFLGLVLIIIYVGAVAILFLFVIMMLNIKNEMEDSEEYGGFYCSVAFVFILFFFLFSYIINSAFINIPSPEVLSYLYPELSYYFSDLYQFDCEARDIYYFEWLYRIMNFSDEYEAPRMPSWIIDILIAQASMYIILNDALLSEFYFSVPPVEEVNWCIFDDLNNIDVLGQVLFNYYLVCFLLSGIILLIALIGSIVLTLKVSTNERSQNTSRQLARTENFISFFK